MYHKHAFTHSPTVSFARLVVAESLEVIQGTIPKDIEGMYIRNTENPIHDSMDGNVNYHPFVSGSILVIGYGVLFMLLQDGDAMLHAIRFSGGKASYRNKFVRTTAFETEQKAGRALWVSYVVICLFAL